MYSFRFMFFICLSLHVHLSHSSFYPIHFFNGMVKWIFSLEKHKQDNRSFSLSLAVSSSLSLVPPTPVSLLKPRAVIEWWRSVRCCAAIVWSHTMTPSLLCSSCPLHAVEEGLWVRGVHYSYYISLHNAQTQHRSPHSYQWVTAA